MATKAQKRFEQEQAIRRLLQEDGIRVAGVYGSPYPTNRSVTRYHVILAIKTEPTFAYEDVEITPELVAKRPEYAPHLGKMAKRSVPSTISYATFACGIDLMQVGGDRSDVIELVDVGGTRATDAPVCQTCTRIVGIADE